MKSSPAEGGREKRWWIVCTGASTDVMRYYLSRVVASTMVCLWTIPTSPERQRALLRSIVVSCMRCTRSSEALRIRTRNSRRRTKPTWLSSNQVGTGKSVMQVDASEQEMQENFMDDRLTAARCWIASWTANSSRSNFMDGLQRHTVVWDLEFPCCRSLLAPPHSTALLPPSLPHEVARRRAVW
jgi:hypothetical protein